MLFLGWLNFSSTSSSAIERSVSEPEREEMRLGRFCREVLLGLDEWLDLVDLLEHLEGRLVDDVVLGR